MSKLHIRLLTTISLLSVTPLAVLANNSHNGDVESSPAVHSSTPHGSGVVTGYGCSPGSASFISGPGKSGCLLQNANHTYGCDGTVTGGGAGANFVGATIGPTPFTGLSFSLRNGKNGTVNVYLLTEQAPYPTYSVSFSNLIAADFTVAP